MKEIKIEFNSVKKQVNEDNELIGYLADGMNIPLAKDNRHYNTVLQWIEDGGVAEEAYTQSELDKLVKDKAITSLNNERTKEVQAITVTIADGTVLDGDEMAQGRLARAVSSLTAEETTTWIDVDGLPHTLTQVQLKEALKLAGEAQTAIWVKYATLKAEL